ncbi:MAG: recombinase family protein [Gemmataceae bacterium]
MKPWGLQWEEAYLRKILSGREILGEYQPFKRNTTGKGPKRIPCGDPVPGYYPAAVTEKEWLEAQAARAR